MTRLLLFIALSALAAPTGAAQSTSATSQTGNGHSVQLLQAGSNAATTDQRGQSHTARVAQGDSGNLLTVSQSGSLNEALIAQGAFIDSDPYNEGTATDNTATVTQSGTGNQGYDPVTTQGDGGVIYQGIVGGTSVGSAASVLQTGDEGVAAVVQGFGGATAMSAIGSIVQGGGTDNHALIDQGLYDASSTNDVARIEQTGSLNAGFVYQGHGAGTVSADNDIQVRQTGTGNWAGVHQAFENAKTATDSDALIVQSGAQNVTSLEQIGVSNTLDLVQTEAVGHGDQGNYSLLLQSDGSSATVRQSGSQNVLQAMSGAPFASAVSVTSVLDLVQTGTGNVLRLDQTGSTATVRASGSFNSAAVVQSL